MTVQEKGLNEKPRTTASMTYRLDTCTGSLLVIGSFFDNRYCVSCWNTRSAKLFTNVNADVTSFYECSAQLRGTCAPLMLFSYVFAALGGRRDSPPGRQPDELPKSSAQSCLRPVLISRNTGSRTAYVYGIVGGEEFGLRPRCFRASRSVGEGQCPGKTAPRLPTWSLNNVPQ